jgi:predicted ribosome quality control (RQC) complex YloA/Tae2 family protein
LTPLLTQLLARELKHLLVSGRLSHISQSSPETVELAFYHPDRPTRTLVAAILPMKPFLFVTTEKRPALPKPLNFCRSLRKNLEYAQLTEVQAEPGERLITFHLKTPEGVFRLVFEGIPKYPNLILVGPDGQIISALRYKNDVERPVMPQVPYGPPPTHSSRYEKEGGPPQPVEKPNFWSLSGKELEGLWQKAGRPPFGAWIKDAFRGTDAELASYLESFGEKAGQEWDHLKTDILEKDWNHYTLLPGPPPSLKIFPAPLSAKDAKVFTTAFPALEELFKLEFLHRSQSLQKTRLEAEINKAVKHEKRILEKLKKDRSEAERSDQYQWWGELLMAQLHKIKLHLREVALEDVVRGTPGTVTIPLDPEITPLQNAQRFFKKAQKGSRGLALVEKREKEIQERMNQLKSAQRSLPALKGPEEIKKAFQDLFPRKPEQAPKPAKPKVEKVPTPNIIRTKMGKGFELCAGTSAAANDYVTFQLAQPGDLWFHVRDLPGSHVILRRLQRNTPVSSEMILQAAQAAAAHSKAKPGAKVTVSYTEKKNVKKIPGAPLGMVTMANEKSLVVEVGPG